MSYDTVAKADFRVFSWGLLALALAVTTTILAHRAKHLVTVVEAFKAGAGLADVVKLDDRRRAEEAATEAIRADLS